MIAFIGSVFSPYYARARRRDAIADPEHYCALNVALYGARGKRWAMTERGGQALERDDDHLRIGPSALDWDGQRLRICCDEVTVPMPSRVRGEICLWPQATSNATFDLDAAGRHQWMPIAPCARVTVRLERPELSWDGHGYWDSNAGSEALEQGFHDWNWSRATAADGTTTVFYDTRARGPDPGANLALRFAANGEQHAIAAPPRVSLARTGWRVGRTSRAEHSDIAVEATLEDTPFYARSLLTTTLWGERMLTMHESLSLDRFRMPLVQWMLPFRMPRRG